MHNLGWLLHGRGEIQEAERWWQHAAEEHEFVPSMHTLAVALHAQGFVVDAGGCTIAALSGDAARQPEDIKTEFAAGIESLTAALQAGSDASPDTGQHTARTAVIDALAHSVGAIMLPRACPDGSALADEILDVCRAAILTSLAHGDGG